MGLTVMQVTEDPPVWKVRYEEEGIIIENVFDADQEPLVQVVGKENDITLVDLNTGEEIGRLGSDPD